MPTAVMSSGRRGDPRTTGTAWGSRAEPGLGHPDHRDAGLGVRVRIQAGPAAGVQVGVPICHQRAQPAQILQDRAQRREFAQAELARPAGRHPGCRRGAFGQHCVKAASAASTAAARAPPVLR
jgi:hypothetical protein